MLYTPSTEVMLERPALVDCSVTFTVAFGTEAPDESVMLPVSVALTTCANESGTSNTPAAKSVRIRTTWLRNINPPSQPMASCILRQMLQCTKPGPHYVSRMHRVYTYAFLD